MNALTLAAPLAGWATRLAEMPDPAFAEGLVGDGVAIDPTSSELRAPCDGVVESVHRARHACTLRAANGAQILLHIGVDTVELKGEGFRVLVENGQQVRTGDPLIRFDMDLVSARARSLLTAVLLVNEDGHRVVERVQDREVAVGDMLLSIAGEAGETATASGSSAQRTARLSIANGLHARPAARFAERARQVQGDVAVACRTRTANGKSLVSLMALDAREADVLTITVTGAEPETAAGELAALVASGLGDPVRSRVADGVERTGDADLLAPGEEVRMRGSVGAPGMAVGRVVRLAGGAAGGTRDVARDGAGATHEEQSLADARAGVRRDIEQTIDGAGAGDAAAIFRAHLDLLDDPELLAAARREIAAGRSAAWAWRKATREVAATLRGLGNPLLAERAGDLVDIERRTLARIAGRMESRLPAELPEQAVLVADELLPSELAAVPPGRLAALCTAGGGPTSHVAILAAGIGVPAVVAIGDELLRVPDGAPAIVDGGRGEVRVFPDAGSVRDAERAIASRNARRASLLTAARQECRTADGVRIAVLANLGRPADAAAALGQGAEGCGLLRTEFLFLDRFAPPGEEEQAAAYQAIADALQGSPLVVRTLDAGGDKALAGLPSAREDNPALGVRGVRLALRHPEILRTQVRAILRVKPAGVCRILVPMVASVAELRAVRAAIDEEGRALDVSAPLLGAMVEVPVAALMAEELAREADFLSIGTNDLSQYALAMDRGNPHLAAELDGLHPGVLRLVATTVSGARAHRRPVTACGGAAGDARAAPLLIGLGVDSLSVAPSLIPELKAQLRTLTLARCAEVSQRALGLADKQAVGALVVETWPGLAAHDQGSE